MSSPIVESSAGLSGRVAEEVVAIGKKPSFDSMTAHASHPPAHAWSWHLYRPGSVAKTGHDARLVLDAGDIVAVCFGAPTVRLIGSSPTVDARLGSLGPDILAEPFEERMAIESLALRSDDPIGVALLDQTAICGIGNVYKSETLFLCRAIRFTGVVVRTSLLARLSRRRTLMARIFINRPAARRAGRSVLVYAARAPLFRCQTTILSTGRNHAPLDILCRAAGCRTTR